jgi:hypothetical protein
MDKMAKEGVENVSEALQAAITDLENTDDAEERLKKSMELFGGTAGLQFSDAIGKGVFQLDDMMKAMGESEGSLAALGESTLTSSDKMDIMKNKVKGAIAPIAGFAGQAGPMLMALPLMTSLIGGMSGAMGALNLSMGPILIAVVAIAAAIAIGIVIWKNWDKIVAAFKATFDAVWNGIKTLFETVMGVIESVFNSKFGWLLPGGALMKALFLLRDNWDTIWNGMKGVVKAIANPIVGIINTVIGAVNALFGALKKVQFGWEKKTKLGITVLPAFQFAPFQNLPTIPTIPSLAKGGIVTSPMLAQIGEAGPEAIVPLSKGGGMGTTVVINFPPSSTVFLDNERSARALGEAITEQIRGVLRAQGAF